MKTNTLILVLGLGALGVGGFLLLKDKEKKAATQTPATFNPPASSGSPSIGDALDSLLTFL
jgi:hypothetical protein